MLSGDPVTFEPFGVLWKRDKEPAGVFPLSVSRREREGFIRAAHDAAVGKSQRVVVIRFGIEHALYM